MRFETVGRFSELAAFLGITSRERASRSCHHPPRDVRAASYPFQRRDRCFRRCHGEFSRGGQNRTEPAAKSAEMSGSSAAATRTASLHFARVVRRRGAGAACRKSQDVEVAGLPVVRSVGRSVGGPAGRAVLKRHQGAVRVGTEKEETTRKRRTIRR